MSMNSDCHRIAEIITTLAMTLVEVVDKRVRERLEKDFAGEPLTAAKPMLSDRTMTKRQVAEYFQVTVRTIELWMK